MKDPDTDGEDGYVPQAGRGQRPGDETGDQTNAQPGGPPDLRPRIIDSNMIFAGRQEVWIRHGAEMYRLRLTSSGRLYLSK